MSSSVPQQSASPPGCRVLLPPLCRGLSAAACRLEGAFCDNAEVTRPKRLVAFCRPLPGRVSTRSCWGCSDWRTVGKVVSNGTTLKLCKKLKLHSTSSSETTDSQTAAHMMYFVPHFKRLPCLCFRCSWAPGSLCHEDCFVGKIVSIVAL
jgi:hypothetical protein